MATETTPRFELRQRHTALGFVVIVFLCLSLAVGFLSVATKKSAPPPDLRATAPVACQQHAC